jgi:hypothetical protein
METMLEQAETIAQKALRLLDSVPKKDWITHRLTDLESRCCALGHYSRLCGNHFDYSLSNCRQGDALQWTSYNFFVNSLGKNLSSNMMNIAHINNAPGICGYNEPEIKDRVIHLLKDMVAAGY